MMKTIKVTARVKTPIAINSPLHLDALLVAIHPSMHNKQAKPTRYDLDNSAIEMPPLPLCSIRSRPEKPYEWVWATTAMEFPKTARLESDVIVKRWTAEDIEQFRLVLATATGALRNRFVKFPIIVTDEAYFYCTTDDVKELARLLRRVRSLGGLRKSGFGLIDGWEIEEIDMPWQEILVKDGIARRRIPASFGDGRPISLSVKPPYWHKSTITLGYDVGDSVKLNEGLVIV